MIGRWLPIALVAPVLFVGLTACSDPGGGGGGGGPFTPDGIIFGDAGDTGGPPDATTPTDAVVPDDGTTPPPDGATTDTGDTGVNDVPTAPDTSGDADASACHAGDLRCDGTAVSRCRSDGSGWELDHQCDADLVCADGKCLACYPSQRRCTPAGAVESCTEDGAWAQTTDCASQGLACVAGSCQSPCTRDPKANSNSGCDYWSIDMDNHPLAQNGPFAVIVSNLSPTTASVKFTVKDSAAATPALVDQRDVPSGQLSIFNLPNRNMGTAGFFWTAYRLESTAPIVAYQFNPLDNVDVFSNDASLLIPSDTFGKEYFAVSRFQLTGKGVADELIPYRGEIDVVASASQTNVTIVPTCATQAGTNMPTMSAGQSYTFTLDPYEVLNVKSNQDGGDLTGSLITSDKPVAVFSGHEAALSSNACCADHLEHQLFPVATWGDTYVATRSMPRGVEPDYWRFIAAQDGTTVSFAPAVAQPHVLNRGQWFEIATQQDFVISADKPISVAQTFASSGEVVNPQAYSDCTLSGVCAPAYQCTSVDAFGDAICYPPDCTPNTSSCPSGHVCTAFPDGSAYCTAVGDPTLILVPPIKQFRKDYVFLSPNKYAFDYVNIIAPADASVTLDGIVVPPANFVAVQGSTWKVARVAVADGTHSMNADQPISVIAYGWDRDVSYGYAAGLNLVVDQ